MRLSKSEENCLKKGRVWCYFDDSYSKNIGIEWHFSPWNIFNCNLNIKGDENEYTFNFWFIWEFYITFSQIFKWYPKEWNSCTNEGKGGYLRTGERKIGISQYNWSLSFYLWHDGEDSWYPKKDKKIFYKWINLEDKLLGRYQYHTIEEKDYEDYITLPENTYKIHVSYRFWHKKYSRWIFRFLNCKGKGVNIEESEIRYPTRKFTEEDAKDCKNSEWLKPDFLERKMERYWVGLKPEQDISEALKQYKEKVIKLRSVESEDWVPYEYRKNFYREQKLKRVLDET